MVPGFEYDVFISYCHNYNLAHWVTEFIRSLQEELAATIKEPISVYFDSNPHDGLLETHIVLLFRFQITCFHAYDLTIFGNDKFAIFFFSAFNKVFISCHQNDIRRNLINLIYEDIYTHIG